MTLQPFPTTLDKRSTNVDAAWQLLYPTGDGTYGVMDLTSMIITEQGRGMAPVKYATRRGVYQHGETPITMRLDPRVVQVVMATDHDSRSQMYDNLARLLKHLSPSRNWPISGGLDECIYRKIMPGGRLQWRSDLITWAGSRQIESATGKFAEWGLDAGDPFNILSGPDAGEYVIEKVYNENLLTLTQAMAWDLTGVEYRVFTGRIVRDLKVLLESGPTLEDDRQDDTMALNDTIRFIAYDPVWRNALQQSLIWPNDDYLNLIFYEPVNWENRARFPTWFYDARIDHFAAQTLVTYAGTWMARPVMIINGPFTNVTVRNLSTGDQLSLYYTANRDERVTIDLDALEVTNNRGESLMRFMSTPYADADSDLITFGLYPDPQVPGGQNLLSVDIDGVDLNVTKVFTNWYSRYVGV